MNNDDAPQALSPQDFEQLLYRREMLFRQEAEWCFFVRSVNPSVVGWCNLCGDTIAEVFVSYRDRIHRSIYDHLCFRCASIKKCTECKNPVGPFGRLISPHCDQWSRVCCPACYETVTHKHNREKWEDIYEMKEKDLTNKVFDLIKHHAKGWFNLRRRYDHCTDQRLWPPVFPTFSGVYFLRIGPLVKVGYAKKFAKRLNAAFIPPHAELVSCVMGPPSAEREMHTLLSGFRIEREWFMFDEELIALFRNFAGKRAEELMIAIRDLRKMPERRIVAALSAA